MVALSRVHKPLDEHVTSSFICVAWGGAHAAPEGEDRVGYVVCSVVRIELDIGFIFKKPSYLGEFNAPTLH